MCQYFRRLKKMTFRNGNWINFPQDQSQMMETMIDAKYLGADVFRSVGF